MQYNSSTTKELTQNHKAIEIVEDSDGDISIGETGSAEPLHEKVVSDHENDADVGEFSEEEVQPVKVRKVQRKLETRETIKEYRKTAASSEEGES
jgi:hypothetical protein